jgi:hypothetical protein
MKNFDIVRRGKDGDPLIDVCYDTVHWRIFIPEDKDPYSGGAKDRCNKENHVVEGFCDDPKVQELVRQLDKDLVAANREANAREQELYDTFFAERRFLERTRWM